MGIGWRSVPGPGGAGTRKGRKNIQESVHRKRPIVRRQGKKIKEKGIQESQGWKRRKEKNGEEMSRIEKERKKKKRTERKCQE